MGITFSFLLFTTCKSRKVYGFIMFLFHIQNRQNHSFVCVCKIFTHLGINTRLHEATFKNPHLTRMALSLSNMHVPNMLFLRNLTPALHKGLLYYSFVSHSGDES
jgi:hypothetical protein